MLQNFCKTGLKSVQYNRLLVTKCSNTSGSNKNVKSLLFSNKNINDTYRNESFFHILRSLMVVKMCTIHSIAKNQDTLIQLGYKILGKRIFENCIRNTIYKQFIAGENAEQVKIIVEKLKSKNVGGILDYGAEADLDSTNVDASANPALIRNRTEAKVFEENFNYEKDIYANALRNFVESIELAGSCQEKVRFAAIKVTALGDTCKMKNINSYFKDLFNIFKLYAGGNIFLNDTSFIRAATQLFPNKTEFVSELYRKHRETTGRDSVYWYDFVDIFYPEDTGKKLSTVLQNLQPNDITESFLIRARIDFLCKICAKNNVKLIVDAEQTYFQKYIHYLTMDLEKKHNIDKYVLYNTLQTYLKNAYNDLLTDIEWSRVDSHKFKIAVKIVRGAYVDQERRLANSEGVECDVFESYEGTNNSFNKVLHECIKTVSKGNFGLVVASHNQSSIEEAVMLMKSYNINPENECIVFAQLLGMGDYISHVLAKKKYNCIRCLPYGSVDEVFPYIVRRVQENRSVLDRAKLDLSLLCNELGNRISIRK